jgi:flagellar hook protein FlgE
VYSSIDGYTDQGAGNQPTDGSAVATTVGSLAFDSSGKFDLTNSTLPTVSWTGVPGVEDLNFTTDFGGNSTLGVPSSSQTASAFSVQGINQNGYAPGQLTGIDISSSGVVNANYSNGKSTSLAKVALVNFANPQGLTQIGNNNWQESLNSGAAIAGEAGTGVYGQIKSGALEQSNVDLTAELVHLIVAQRNFQANAKSISTASQVTDTIINVR